MTLQLFDITEGIETTTIIVVESLKKYPKYETDEDCEMEIRKLTVSELNKIENMTGGFDFNIPMELIDKMLSAGDKEQAKDKFSKELSDAFKKQEMSISTSEQDEKSFKAKIETLRCGLDVNRKKKYSTSDVDAHMPDIEVMDEIYTKIMIFTNGGEEDLEKAVEDFPEESQE